MGGVSHACNGLELLEVEPMGSLLFTIAAASPSALFLQFLLLLRSLPSLPLLLLPGGPDGASGVAGVAARGRSAANRRQLDL